MSHPEKVIPSGQKRTREKWGSLVLSKDTVFQMRDDVNMLEVRDCHLCPSKQQRLSTLWSSHSTCAATLPLAPPQGTFPNFYRSVAQTSTRASELICTCEMENVNISLILNYHGCVCMRLWRIFQRIRRIYSVIERIFTFWERGLDHDWKWWANGIWALSGSL